MKIADEQHEGLFSRFLKAPIMHRISTFSGTCSGFLIIISLATVSASWGQNSDARNLRPEVEQRKEKKKETTGGLWSSATKLRKRFLPFTVDRDETKDASSDQQRQAIAPVDRRKQIQKSRSADKGDKPAVKNRSNESST